MNSDNTPDSAAPKEIDPRRCTHPGKDGTGCKAYALKDGSGLCQGHAATPEQLAIARQRSAEVRRSIVEERPKSLKDALGKLLTQQADEILEVVKHDIKQKDSRAVMGWIEQVHGKPQQTVLNETAEKPAGELTLSELEAARAKLLRDSNVTDLRKPASQAG